MQGVLIYFSLNCHLVQFLVLFYTLSITFYTFFGPIHSFFRFKKKLYCTGISSPYHDPRLILFPVTLHLMAQLGRVRKRLKVLLKFFGTCPPVRPPIVTATAYLPCSLSSSYFKNKHYLQLLVSIPPYTHNILKYMNQMRITFLFE